MNNRKSSRSSQNQKQSLAIIGWREFISFPQLGIESIKAKIDTGARSSAIHAFNLQQFEREGQSWLKFQVHPKQRNSHYTIDAEAELLEYREVKNSGGVTQLRPVILTTVQLAQQQWQIELTLTNRDLMGFRLLLGRQAVRHKFLVNPGKSFLQSCQIREK